MSDGLKALVTSCVLVSTVLAGWFVIWLMGSHNPETPAGYVGYLTQGAVFGKTQFYGLQKGPTSPGRTWMVSTTNVSVTPYTFTEDFEGENAVLAKDNLKVEFRVHVVWKVKPEAVQDFVEKYSTLGNNDNPDGIVTTAYKNFLKEPLRTYARDEVQKHNGLDIKDNITPIGEKILSRVIELTSNTPFEIRSVVVGNIQYPSVVADAVSNKLALTQDLQRMDTEVAIEKKKNEKRVIEADGIAQAMAIINEKLTANYLQHEAIEAQKMMVNSPNHTVVYIPSGAMGLPLVGALDLSKGTE